MYSFRGHPSLLKSNSHARMPMYRVVYASCRASRARFSAPGGLPRTPRMARPADVVVAVIGAVVRCNEPRDPSQVERENLIQEKLSLNLRRGRGSGVSHANQRWRFSTAVTRHDSHQEIPLPSWRTAARSGITSVPWLISWAYETSGRLSMSFLLWFPHTPVDAGLPTLGPALATCSLAGCNGLRHLESTLLLWATLQRFECPSGLCVASVCLVWKLRPLGGIVGVPSSVACDWRDAFAYAF
jgi:hypothetical protein